MLSDNCHDISNQNNYEFVMYKMRFKHKNKNLPIKLQLTAKQNSHAKITITNIR